MIEPRQVVRPLERLVLRLVAEGVGDVEIGRRFRRSPEMIRRIDTMARLPRTVRARAVSDDGLRPLERRILRWRHYGATYAEIGARFRRSPAFVARVETLAHYKLDELIAQQAERRPEQWCTSSWPRAGDSAERW